MSMTNPPFPCSLVRRRCIPCKKTTTPFSINRTIRALNSEIGLQSMPPVEPRACRRNKSLEDHPNEHHALRSKNSSVPGILPSSSQQKGTISINTTAPNKTNNARFQGTPTCSLHNPFPARSGEKTLVHKNHKNQSVLGDPLETNIRFNRYPASANANDNCPPQPRLEELPRLVHAHMGATESV